MKEIMPTLIKGKAYAQYSQMQKELELLASEHDCYKNRK
jgi:hypothetical protein